MVIGVSGGSDSVALACAMGLAQTQHALHSSEPAGKRIIAWFDHGIRNVDFERACVERLANALSFDLIQGSQTTQLVSSKALSREGATGDISAHEGATSEASLRQARHAFFLSTLKQTGGRYLTLAHTFEDQVETVLQRLFRGTGIRGALGMRTFRPLDQDWVLARPLLHTKRSELRAMLAELNQAYCDDPTNTDQRWTRNWLRHGILPLIEERYPGASSAIHRFSQQLGTHESAIAVWVEQLMDRACEVNHDVVQVNLAEFDGVPDLLFIEVVRRIWREQQWPELDMSEQHWIQLGERCKQSMMSDATTQAMDLPGGIHAVIQYRCLRLQK